MFYISNKIYQKRKNTVLLGWRNSILKHKNTTYISASPLPQVGIQLAERIRWSISYIMRDDCPLGGHVFGQTTEQPLWLAPFIQTWEVGTKLIFWILKQKMWWRRYISIFNTCFLKCACVCFYEASNRLRIQSWSQFVLD